MIRKKRLFNKSCQELKISVQRNSEEKHTYSRVMLHAEVIKRGTSCLSTDYVTNLSDDLESF